MCPVPLMHVIFALMGLSNFNLCFPKLPLLFFIVFRLVCIQLCIDKTCFKGLQRSRVRVGRSLYGHMNAAVPGTRLFGNQLGTVSHTDIVLPGQWQSACPWLLCLLGLVSLEVYAGYSTVCSVTAQLYWQSAFVSADSPACIPSSWHLYLRYENCCQPCCCLRPN